MGIPSDNPAEGPNHNVPGQQPNGGGASNGGPNGEANGGGSAGIGSVPQSVDTVVNQSAPETNQLQGEIQKLEQRIQKLAQRPGQGELEECRSRARQAVQIAFRLGVQRAINAIRQRF